MAPWTNEVPEGYSCPGLLTLDASGLARIRSSYDEYAYLNRPGPSQPPPTLNRPEHRNYYRGTEDRIQIEDPGGGFLWSMSAVLAYDAQMRSEQFERHRIAIENARRSYRERTGALIHPETCSEGSTVTWTSAKVYLGGVIDWLENELLTQPEGCQQRKATEAWIMWAKTAREGNRNVRLEEILKVYTFLDEQSQSKDPVENSPNSDDHHNGMVEGNLTGFSGEVAADANAKIKSGVQFELEIKIGSEVKIKSEESGSEVGIRGQLEAY